ncbi:hypothetical protein GGR53DRAFT_77745 [Hypoxylon sp. FL1150]|nr:hypothetical protein GGR53DRAFT_77745 [Hypoxylon sp. FL1150]
MKQPGRVVAHDSTALLASDGRGDFPSWEHDNRIMAHLWLSETRRAMITVFHALQKWERTAKFNPEIQFLDTAAVKRSREDSEDESEQSEPKPGSHEVRAPPRSRVDLWAEGDKAARTLKLLHRLLKHIEEIGEDRVRQGKPNFLLRHLRKHSAKMDVLHSNSLIFDLISPRTINELELAASRGDDEEIENDEGVDENSENDEEEQSKSQNESGKGKRMRVVRRMAARRMAASVQGEVLDWLSGVDDPQVGTPFWEDLDAGGIDGDDDTIDDM